MKVNMITGTLFLVLAGLWFYLGLAGQKYYFALSCLAVIVAVLQFWLYITRKRKGKND